MTVMAVALSFGLASCSDKKEDVPAEGAAPQLLTFSFNVAQNAEAISADCEGVINEADKTVKVTMPAFADKSALVATFTVGQDNKVLVNGVAQESGVTPNDFSAPVDYIISNADGSQNVKYTVTVEKAADYEWTEIARYNEVTPRGNNAIMKINPADNTPYIAFINKANNLVVVMKNDNGAFSYLGSSEGVSSEVAAGRFDFTISSTGKPYFIYGDNSITEPVKAAATAMAFDGSSWSNVGQPGIAGFVPSKLKIGVVGNDVVAPLIVNANNGDFKKREIYSSIYNGSWETKSLASVGMNTATVECMTTTANAAYLYTITAVNPYSYSVAEYKNGVWTALRSDYLEEGATQANVLMADAASIVATNDGVIYLLTADDSVSGDEKNMDFRVLKYTPDNQQWTLVGGDVIRSVKANDSHLSAKLAIAPDGTVFLAYDDYKNDKLVKVQYFDNETKQWTDPIAVSAEKATSVNIGFCDNGEAYLSYVDSENSNIVLLKYAAKK